MAPKNQTQDGKTDIDNPNTTRGQNPNLGHPTGPTSKEGIVASDFPDDGRGTPESDPGYELDRHVPQHTGEVTGSQINTDTGLTGDPDIRQADRETSGPERHQGDAKK